MEFTIRTQRLGLLVLILFFCGSGLVQAQEGAALLGEPEQSPVAKTEANLKVNGLISAVFNFFERPTAIQNNFDFDTPQLGLSFSNHSGLGEGSRVFWQLGLRSTGEPERDPQTGAKALAFSTASIQVNEGGTQNHFLVGLLESPILEFEERHWNGALLGEAYGGLLRRSNLIPRSDYGARILFHKDESSVTVGLGLQNGEGPNEPEAGPGKDWLFWLNFESENRKLKSQVFFQSGRYGGLPFDASARTRGGFSIGYFGENIDLFLSGLEAQDAVDGIRRQYWDGANLAARGGFITSSQGALVRLTYHRGGYALHFQGLAVDPDSKIRNNSFQSTLFAIEKTLGPGQSLWLGKVESSYLDDHSPGIDDKASWALGLLLSF